MQDRTESPVIVAGAQRVLTLDHGPVLASELIGLPRFRVLSYDFDLCRYSSAGASAHSGQTRPMVRITAGGEEFLLADGQPLSLSDAGQAEVSELAAGDRLFGVTVDQDEHGRTRVHLRDGLEGKALAAEMQDLPGEQPDGAHTPHGIESDRELSTISDPFVAETVLVHTDGPHNLIIWPDEKPVGLGLLVGV